MEMWGPGEEWGWWASGFVRNKTKQCLPGVGMQRLWNGSSRKISLRKLIGCSILSKELKTHGPVGPVRHQRLEGHFFTVPLDEISRLYL